MNLASLLNLVLLGALVYLGWWLRGRYGSKAPAILRQDPFSQAVSAPAATDEEKIILEEYRKRKAEAEAKEAEANRQAILAKAFQNSAP